MNVLNVLPIDCNLRGLLFSCLVASIRSVLYYLGLPSCVKKIVDGKGFDGIIFLPSLIVFMHRGRLERMLSSSGGWTQPTCFIYPLER